MLHSWNSGELQERRADDQTISSIEPKNGETNVLYLMSTECARYNSERWSSLDHDDGWKRIPSLLVKCAQCTAIVETVVNEPFILLQSQYSCSPSSSFPSLLVVRLLVNPWFLQITLPTLKTTLSLNSLSLVKYLQFHYCNHPLLVPSSALNQLTAYKLGPDLWTPELTNLHGQLRLELI